jgi:iron complex transport system ATP-binding protein
MIALDGVTVRYGEGDAALSSVSLEVALGEIVAVLGPNGAGKSTLLRAIAGTLPASSGSVRLGGEDVASLDRRTLARSVAFVTQSSDVAFGFSVRDVVMMGRAPHQGSWMSASAADEAAVDDAMRALDLEPFATRRVDAMSGGEQKRVAIARALAQSPRVLLLDEPGAFLDVRHALALYDLLSDLAEKKSMAIVVTMHDVNAAAQYASRVALLKSGKVVAIGTVDDVLTYRTLKETFDADLYCGVNDVNGARFFLPMRKSLTARR